jgi:hypothetical protein
VGGGPGDRGDGTETSLSQNVGGQGRGIANGRRLRRRGEGRGGGDERQGLRPGQGAPLALASPPNVAEVRCRSPFSTKKQRLAVASCPQATGGGQCAVRSQV